MNCGLRHSNAAAGFTIVETMIVLAVTGVLFIAIASSWSTRQRANEFTTGTQDIRSRIDQAIGDVRNGYFPSQAGFSCSKSGNELLLKTPLGGGTQQGENSQCIFLGKVIQFQNNADSYRIYTVAALNQLGTSDLFSSKPLVVAPSVRATQLSTDLSDEQKTLYGLAPVAMESKDGTPLQAVAFLSTLGDDSSGGVQQVDMYGLGPGLANINVTSRTAANTINNALRDGTLGSRANDSVRICFKSAGTDQYVLASIGDSGGGLSTKLQVFPDDSGGHPCGL